MKLKPYIKIEKSIVENPNLTPTAKIIYGLIMDRFSLSLKNQDTFSDKKGYLFCYLAYDDLTSWLGVSRTTIWRELRKLKKEKLIRIRRQGQQMPNMIYPLQNGGKVMFQIETSGCFKSKHQDVSNLNVNDLEVKEPEGIKEKRESKKKNAFRSSPPDDIKRLIVQTIQGQDLKNLIGDPEKHAEIIYGYLDANEWIRSNKKKIRDENDLIAFVKSWNFMEEKFKSDLKGGKSKANPEEPEFMVDYLEELKNLKPVNE